MLALRDDSGTPLLCSNSEKSQKNSVTPSRSSALIGGLQMGDLGPTSFRMWIRRKVLEQPIDQRSRHVGAKKRSVLNERNLADDSSIAISRKLLSDTPSKILGESCGSKFAA